MELNSILTPERTFARIETTSKKNAIEQAAIKLAESDSRLDMPTLYSALIAREKLGPTAIGFGVAIPHCRLNSCDQITGGLFSFESPVDFDAYDNELVNIMFVLLVPEQETKDHLATLAMLARRFESSDYRHGLTEARTNHELFEIAMREPAEDISQSAV